MVGRKPIIIAMTIGPVAAAMKSMIVWSSVFTEAKPRVNRLEPACRTDSPNPIPLTP